MKPADTKKCDRLFQQTLIKENPISLLGGESQVIHHFYGRINMSTRYWRPNGIALTHAQHDQIESKGGKFIREEIRLYKGEEWFLALQHRANRIAKGVKVEDVVAYLQNEISDYLNKLQ